MIPSFLLREMRHDDLPRVTEIDRSSFALPWSIRTYEFELENRGTSHLVVLQELDSFPAGTGRMFEMLRRLRRQLPRGQVIGYGGFWLIAGEAHISTIAVDQAHRGRGLGEVLLVGMLQRALNGDAAYSVLEVRESNHTAQALYEKYEYRVVGRRRAYYRDNNEDALLMEARPFDDAYRQRFAGRVAALQQRVAYRDQFSAQHQP